MGEVIRKPEDGLTEKTLTPEQIQELNKLGSANTGAKEIKSGSEGDEGVAGQDLPDFQKDHSFYEENRGKPRDDQEK